MAAKRALTHLLLAFALLLAQQVTLAHATTHLAQPPANQDKQLPHHKVCDQCMLSAQFGSALVGKTLTFDPPRGVACLPPEDPRVVHRSTLRAFRSRAPPASL
jgi:hypothetical protein